MREYFITARKNLEIFRDVQVKGGAETYRLDASSWAEDNTAITTATWELVSGQVAISGEVLASNVATALLAFSESGGSLIKVTLDSGVEKFVAHIDVVAKDPIRFQNDYGLCEWW